MDVIKLAPSEIRFSQDSISNSFGDNTYHAGQYIGESLDDIVRNPDTADLIPCISVFNKDGKWFTSDNRRLWVFRKAEELGILSSIDVYVTYEIDYSKFTTTCGGRYVRVRRNNPGGHLWQSLQRQMIEQQAREHRRRQQMETERQRKEMEQQMKIEQQRRARKQQRERERQRRERKVPQQDMEIERQRREREVPQQDMEIERQRREREQMNIDQQGGVNIIRSVIGRIVATIVRIFRYWTSPH